MFELPLQKFWAKKTLVKSLLISTLDKVIYNNGTFSLGSTKPLITTQNRVEISWKKSPFFEHASSSVDPTISMPNTCSLLDVKFICRQ
jgi:hypothetical protein